MPTAPGTTDVESELSALIDYIQTGLLTAALRRRLGHFPEGELRMALRDVLDWLSLRCILRGRTASLSGQVHPLTGRVVARLEGLSRYLCVPDGELAFRVEVPAEARWEVESYVNRRIWHPVQRESAPVKAERMELYQRSI